MAPVRRIFFLIGVYSLFLNLLVLAVPLYLLQIYDRVLVSRSADTLVMITILAVLALAVFGLLEGVRGVMASRAAARFEVGVSPAVLERLVRDERPERFGAEPLRDMTLVRGFIGNRVALSLLDLPFAPIFVVLVFLIHPVLGYVTLFGALLLVCLAAANDAVTLGPQREALRDARASMITAQSLIRNADSIKAMGMLDAGLAKWTGGQIGALIGQDRVGTRNAAFFAMTRFFRLLLQIAVLGLGAYFVLHEEMTAGMIFASSIVSARALGPIEQAVGGWKSLTQARLAYKRLKQLFQETGTAERRTKLPDPEGRIEVERLVFTAPGSPGQERILKGISFSLEAGEALAVVGPSGAGKSTLARLLAGAATPASGCVRLDGADIAVWPDEARFRHFGYLPQSIDLMPGTIAENIARFDPDRRDEDVVEAAKRAGVHELVTQLAEAYETRVGPGGRPLSGGQTQRIALARAFYGSPTFVILDEPNAHLDYEGEKQLSETIAAAKARKTTTVTVTQRTSILEAVDKILLLREGRAEAFGPRNEVLPHLVPRPPQPRTPEEKHATSGKVTARLVPVRRVANDSGSA
ncbi:MAG: type I secretion system permease/ATPase [Hyphomicrobiales bacterium]|nr:type I secretion system permease/ATPase [Hyphomicrobiales bacterium]